MNRSHAISRNATPRCPRWLRPRAEMLEGRLLLSAGDLDTSFGAGGSVFWSSPAAKNSTPSDIAYAVKTQPDGKILVAGGTGSLNSSDRFEVIRLQATGAVDTTFGSAGLALPLSGGYLSDMALQPDGSIVLAGSVAVTTGSGKTAVTQSDIALVRLLSNGTPDPSFGPNHDGKVITGSSTLGSKADGAYAVTLQPDGRIVVGGYTDGGSSSGIDSILLRYNSNGDLDTSFGQGGKIVTAWSTGEDNIADVVIQGDGKILVAGKGYLNGNGSYPYFVARYNANGSLDDGSGNDTTPGDRFGTSGIVTTPFGGAGSGGISGGDMLALQSDGPIILSRSSYNGTDYDLAVARFTTTGALDVVGFGSGNGYVTLSLGENQLGRSVAVQADDKIVIAGDSGSVTHQIIARLQPNGSPDTGFGSGGIVISSFSANTHDMSLQADGKVVAVGSARIPVGKTTTNAFLITRYLGDSVIPSLMASRQAANQASPSMVGSPSELLAGSTGSDQDLTTLATELVRSRMRRPWLVTLR